MTRILHKLSEPLYNRLTMISIREVINIRSKQILFFILFSSCSLLPVIMVRVCENLY